MTNELCIATRRPALFRLLVARLHALASTQRYRPRRCFRRGSLIEPEHHLESSGSPAHVCIGVRTRVHADPVDRLASALRRWWPHLFHRCQALALVLGRQHLRIGRQRHARLRRPNREHVGVSEESICVLKQSDVSLMKVEALHAEKPLRSPHYSLAVALASFSRSTIRGAMKSRNART
jgi:hypothetical protein